MAKRIWRNDMPQQQRNKIAAANKGKTLSIATRQKIAAAMAKYWAGLPMKPDTSGTTGTGTTTGTTPEAWEPFPHLTGVIKNKPPPRPQRTGGGVPEAFLSRE